MSEDKQKDIFSKNLNSYIENSGKTQLEIARSIGVSPQTFNTWCKGIAIPRMGKVQALADYFHIKKSDLIDNKSHPSDLPKIMQYYDQLNDLGKHEATKRVEELTYLPQYADSSIVNAANAIPGASAADRQHDEDIMDDENF